MRTANGLAFALVAVLTGLSPAPASAVGGAVRVGRASPAVQRQVVQSFGVFLQTPNPASRGEFLARLSGFSMQASPDLRASMQSTLGGLRTLDIISAQLPIAGIPVESLSQWQASMRDVLQVLQMPQVLYGLNDDQVMIIHREAERHGVALTDGAIASLTAEALAIAATLQEGTRGAETLAARIEPVRPDAPSDGPRGSRSRLRPASPRGARVETTVDEVPRPQARRRATPSRPSRFVSALQTGAFSVGAVILGSSFVSFLKNAYSVEAAAAFIAAIALAAVVAGNLRGMRRFAALNILLAAGAGAYAMPLFATGVPFAVAAVLSLALAGAVYAVTSPRRTLRDIQKLPALWRRIAAIARRAAQLSPVVVPMAAALAALAMPLLAPALFPANAALVHLVTAGVAAAASALVLFLSRRPALRAAGGLALGLSAASLSLLFGNPAPLALAAVGVAASYARTAASLKTLAVNAAGVVALAVGLMGIGWLAVAYPLGGALMAVTATLALGQRARALGAVIAASLVISYALSWLAPAGLTLLLSGIGLPFVLPVEAMLSGVIGGALVAIAYASRVPERAGPVLARAVKNASPMAVALAAVFIGAVLAGAGTVALPLSALSLMAYLLSRSAELGAVRTLTQGLLLSAFAGAAAYLGMPALFAAFLIWHALMRPEAAPAAPDAKPRRVEAALGRVFGAF